MKPIAKEEIMNYNAEQIAGIALKILQEIDRREKTVTYNEGSIKSILSFEFAPRWLGKEIRNGCLVFPNGGVTVYGGDQAPERLETLYVEGIEILRTEQLIKQDPMQRSSEYITITDKGRKMKINNAFELNINRKPEDIIDRYKKSVFQIETVKNNEISSGTCFLMEDGCLITCKHNVEGRKFTVLFDGTHHLVDSLFNVQLHLKCDLAKLTFKSERTRSIFNDIVPLQIEEGELSLGEQLVTIGFPLISQRNPQLLPDVGIYQNYTESYRDGSKYLTFTNKVDGGCSGGPLISLRGKVVGVITEVTEQTSSTEGKRSEGSSIFRHAAPVRLIRDI